ncbi:RING-H2 finger protein ATL70-like [Impatiens glandulifera]|uniref:RING-H2 finger protein ATL70-like n=1 Tax=Impatiens glandulifera TaxID=253017 RepID=UPI001FB05283|nr:RING-H2 finger protein ATL70-like [Impatiens glandulifera]
MNSSTTTFSDPADDTEYSEDGERPGGYAYGLGLCLSLLLVLAIITYISYICSRKRSLVGGVRDPLSDPESTSDVDLSNTDDNPHSGGLDEATLGNYPKLLYSQAKLNAGGYGGGGCSICLTDYKDTDILRHLPQCGHLFHLMCVDPWLKLRSTCPICRN